MEFDFIFVSTSVWSSVGHDFARAHAHKETVMPKESRHSQILSERIDIRRAAILDYLRQHNGRADRGELWELFGDTAVMHIALEGLQDQGLVSFESYGGEMKVILTNED